MELQELVLKIFNENLHMPTTKEQIKKQAFVYQRGNVVIFLDNLNAASQSENHGGNNYRGEHFIAKGITRGVPWYAIAIK